jgi:hypothetical protein
MKTAKFLTRFPILFLVFFFVFVNSTFAQVSKKDFKALVAIYKATDGANIASLKRLYLGGNQLNCTISPELSIIVEVNNTDVKFDKM